MATKTNLYMDKIQQEHPIAAWTLDDEFTSDTPRIVADSFISTFTSIVVSSQTITYVSGITTMSTSSQHGFAVGDTILFENVLPATYRKRFIVTEIVSTTSFKINTGSNLGNIVSSGTVKKVYDAYELKAYNSFKYPGYVFTTKTPTSKMPIIYNSSNSQYGSMLIPSFGFLSSSGKYNQYTFETWVKIKNKTKSTASLYKIVGLFNNNSFTDDGNGLYYTGYGFLLKLGSKSDFVTIKEVNKPLLIHLTYSENSISLLVNGEQLITLILDESDINQLATPSNSKQYLMLQSATFDCPAIYPYKLSLNQAKVHYAYGQAVSVPENIVRKYGGKNIAIDFASARYAANLNYPLNAEWKNGISENLNIQQYSISNNKYSLPTINLYDPVNEVFGTIDDFYTYNPANNTTWYSQSGSYTNCNFNFETLNLFNEKIKGFYTYFYISSGSMPATTDSEKTIFKIINKFDKNYFLISIKNEAGTLKTKYKIKYNSNSEQLLFEESNAYVTSGGQNYFLIGLDIDKFATKYGTDTYNASRFFNNLEELTMFVFGDNDLTKNTTQLATIQNISFLTKYTLNTKSILVTSNGTFSPTGIATSNSAQQLAEALPSTYSIDAAEQRIVNPAYPSGTTTSYKNYLTYKTYGYWKNAIPLSHFAKYVKDGANNDTYTFNNIQFNIDCDSPMSSGNPISGIRYFSTHSSEILKTYITFEPISSEYKPDTYFTNGIKDLSIDRVVRPDSNWATTKYQVVDGTIIYPPTGVDISTLNIVVHIESIIQDGTYQSINIKYLELASQALSLVSSDQNPVYTKYGNKIIPYTYTLSGATKIYDYSNIGNARNPFLIEKKTSPHLSLERLSGIRLVGFDIAPAGVYRGIRIPINEKQNSKAKVTSIHMFIYYDATLQPGGTASFKFDTAEIFNIVTSDRTLTATLTNTSGISGTYYETATLSISSTLAGSGIDDNIKYYINGEKTTTPTLTTNDWTILTIEFTTPLNFNNFVGEFNITGPMSFDNISFYGLSNTQYDSNVNSNSSWEFVWKPDLINLQNWNSFGSNIWSDLLYNINNNYIEPTKINDVYLGTNILYPGIYKRTEAPSVADVQYRLYSGYRSVKYTYSAN